MYKNTIKPYVLFIVLAIFVDQATKTYFINFFIDDPEKVILVFPGLAIVNAWNEGISFGLFADLAYSNTIFLLLSITIVIILIVILFKEKTHIYSLSYAMIIGGAIGNIIDRFKYDAVYDFIDIYILHYHWPAFNIADSCVCLGVLLILIYSFKVKH